MAGPGTPPPSRLPEARPRRGGRTRTAACSPAPLEEWEGRMNVGTSHSVTTAIRESIRDTLIGKIRNSEKADRATVEQANVYHATKADGQELAIKVYKTSILVFKDRDRYIRGDYCFRHGYCKHNPRKMVKTWAEKEMRNLKRERRLGSSSSKGCYSVR